MAPPRFGAPTFTPGGWGGGGAQPYNPYNTYTPAGSQPPPAPAPAPAAGGGWPQHSGPGTSGGFGGGGSIGDAPAGPGLNHPPAPYPGSPNITNPHGGAGPTPNPVTIPFADIARALYPWLPADLLNIYVQAYTASGGNQEYGLAMMRASAAYDTYFPGNRRPDGTIRNTELEYLSVVDGYTATFGGYGLNPEVFRHRYRELIEGETSVAELQDDLHAQWVGVVEQGDTVRQFYADNYGIALSNEAILAAAIDPNVDNDIRDGKITSAQIGGAARFYGFTPEQRQGSELARVDELRRLGATQQQARRVYAQAQGEVPQLGRFAGRYNEQAGFGIEDYESYGFLGTAEETQRRQRLIGREQAAFSRAPTFAQQQQSGGLTGLTQR
jgi:hypothetical protein